MYAMFLLSIFDGLDFDQLGAAFVWTIVIGISPLFLHVVFCLIYAIWQTIFNAIRAWLGKPLEDILGVEEIGLLGVITRARRKQEIEKESEQKIEQEKNRAAVCEMLNSNTEILTGSFEHYGLTLRSIRIHPYDDDEYACDLEIEANKNKKLSDDVYIHVHLLDDQEVETESLDIIIEAEDFSGYEVVENYDFSISSDSMPTHMKVYIDRKSWS